MHRRAVLLLVGAALLAAGVVGLALDRSGDPTAPLTVTWGGSEGHPPCVYDPDTHGVAARLVVDGDAGQHRELTVTVTAYADENTSVPVGSSTRTLPVEGTVHRSLVLTVPVAGKPHVDEDGVAACRRVVQLDRAGRDPS